MIVSPHLTITKDPSHTPLSLPTGSRGRPARADPYHRVQERYITLRLMLFSNKGEDCGPKLNYPPFTVKITSFFTHRNVRNDTVSYPQITKMLEIDDKTQSICVPFVGFGTFTTSTRKRASLRLNQRWGIVAGLSTSMSFPTSPCSSPISTTPVPSRT